MGTWLSEREQRLVAGAEAASAATPIPTQIVSNGEYLPPPQSATQKKVEARINELADAERQAARLEPPAVPAHELRHGGGIPRNERHLRQRLPGRARRGRASPSCCWRARKASPASSSSTSRPISCATTSTTRSFWAWRRYASEHWNPKMKEEGVISLARYKFQNYVKEIYYDSDTNMALLSGAPFDDPSWWLLSNEQIVKARELDQRLRRVPAPAGAQRHHAQAARLDGGGRQGDRGLQAQFAGRATRSAIRWQPVQVPVAARRRAADVSVLRQGGEGRHQHAVHPQGTAAARLREVVRRACGNTQPLGTSERRRRTGRR